MSSIKVKESIDTFYNSFADSFERKNKEFNASFNNVYKLGNLIEKNVPNIIDKRTQYGKSGNNTEFKYVSWKWYEYILKKLDSDFWWELVEYSPNYQMVKVKIIWLGKEYSGWYAVEDSPLKKDKDKKPIKLPDGTYEKVKNFGEMVVDEGMRCFAKLASRATGLFLHLWLEGGND